MSGLRDQGIVQVYEIGVAFADFVFAQRELEGYVVLSEGLAALGRGRGCDGDGDCQWCHALGVSESLVRLLGLRLGAIVYV